MGHKWLKKKSVSLVEKNVRKTERFFDNHYKWKKLLKERIYNTIQQQNLWNR
jgi:hypothetical protein